MYRHALEKWQHSHDFSLIPKKGKKRTQQVLVITAITMIIEIIAGNMFGSMALLADGLHMGTHVAAFAISVFAYSYTKKHANNPTFSFGTGKMSALGGFASAMALSVVALVMALESVTRLFNPQEIHFNEAIAVAVLGLVVNVVCVFILHDNHSHDNHEANGEILHDHNLRAAYFHVLADALTSLLAIIALLSGKYFGWAWMDPTMGIVGAMVITRWSYGLIKDTNSILLDHSIDEEVITKIKETIEAEPDTRVSDAHIWKVGPINYAAILSLVTYNPKPPDYYKNLLVGFDKLTHVTVEVNTFHKDHKDVK